MQRNEDKPVQSSSMIPTEKLDAATKSAVIEKKSKPLDNNMKHLQKELKMFEVTGEKTNNIRCLIDAMKTVPSTSIESERALSTTGPFITKLRTILSDHSIDRLSFQKSHYKNIAL